jgi:hypothetical protein
MYSQIQNNIKKIKLIPDNKEEFLKNIKLLSIDDKYKKFIIDAVNLKVIDGVDDRDIFYIDKPYKYNFYNYSQKLTIKDKLNIKKLGFNNKEINYSNYDFNYYKNDVAIKKGFKNHNSSENYYEYLLQNNLIIDYDKKTNLIKYDYIPYTNEINLNEDYFKTLINNIHIYWDQYELWTNNINLCSYRNNSFNDPDMFFWKDTTEEIKEITNLENFISEYRYYKLRPKTIIYKISQNTLPENIIKYLYYSYYILENLSKRF